MNQELHGSIYLHGSITWKNNVEYELYWGQILGKFLLGQIKKHPPWKLWLTFHLLISLFHLFLLQKSQRRVDLSQRLTILRVHWILATYQSQKSPLVQWTHFHMLQNHLFLCNHFWLPLDHFQMDEELWGHIFMIHLFVKTFFSYFVQKKQILLSFPIFLLFPICFSYFFTQEAF